MSTHFYPQQAPALDEARARGWHPYAFDINLTGSKKYASSPWICLPSDAHAYEIIMPDRPSHIYLDVEGISSGPEGDEEYAALMLAEVRAATQEALADIDPRAEIAHWGVLTARCLVKKPGNPWDGLFKESYHIVAVARSKERPEVQLVLRNREARCEFYRALRVRAEAREALFCSHPKLGRILVIDLCVDKSNQCWRMLGQTKFAGRNPLIPHESAWPDPNGWSRALVPRDFEASPLCVPLRRIGGPLAPSALSVYAASNPATISVLQAFITHCAEPTGEKLYRQLWLISHDGTWSMSGCRFIMRGCSDFNALLCYLKMEEPIALHVGPWRREPKHDSPPAWRELVFDIDLPDYNKPPRKRPCACGDSKRACRACWLFAESAMAFLKICLADVFSLKNLVFFYSGSKGFHCWVVDTSPQLGYSEKMRSWLVTHLQKKIWRAKECPAGLFEKLYEKAVAPFYSAMLRECIEMRATRAANKFDEFDFMAPQIDALVTSSLSHNIKAPMTIHPSTGRMARELTVDLSSFAPHSTWIDSMGQ